MPDTLPTELSVALSGVVDAAMATHLIREDQEEDVLFALWTPSNGATRLTALVHTPLFPLDGDRQRHGNASFNPQYLERACAEAAREGCGLSFLHSHPGPGWQGMSRDDVRAELRMAGAVAALTDLPLLGMTVGNDGTWSARMWERTAPKEYQRRWCHSVRVLGETLRVSFTDALVPPPRWREEFKRTVTVWGEEAHGTLARLRVGIVGLGSVGSVVAEALARMGIERFVLIDFDEVQRHNLDRLLGATRRDLGKRKVDIAARQIRRAATADKVDILRVPHAVTEEEGYRAAMDCDVLFSCVDRPWPRQVLNHLAYGHLIPVIDGGIQVRFRRGRFTGADWQVQTVGPGRRCLECLQAFYPGDAATEREGKLDDPSYLAGLPADHRFKRNESVFPFSANLATLEVMHLVALATGTPGIEAGTQRFRTMPGIMEQLGEELCGDGCDAASLVGQGDRFFSLFGHDHSAAQARTRQNSATVVSST
ncbi:MAG: ThiF family adenylyltransferase [Gemmatimonadetes bacterium]|nr:ThiF family adenylyltransferase [Gemmatimonadota bacterium]